MYYISGFYKFKKISNLKKYKKSMQVYFNNKDIRGSIIIAKEGINGTISTKKKILNGAINKIKKTFSISNFDSINYSKCLYQPFHRGKIKIKKKLFLWE